MSLLRAALVVVAFRLQLSFAAPTFTFEAPVPMGTQDYYTTGFMGFPDGLHALGKTEGGWVATSGESGLETLDVPLSTLTPSDDNATDAAKSWHKIKLVRLATLLFLASVWLSLTH